MHRCRVTRADLSKLGQFLTRFISKTKSVTPQFFSISDIGNSLYDCSQSMKKICIVEDFRANVLKCIKSKEKLKCLSYKEQRMIKLFLDVYWNQSQQVGLQLTLVRERLYSEAKKRQTTNKKLLVVTPTNLHHYWTLQCHNLGISGRSTSLTIRVSAHLSPSTSKLPSLHIKRPPFFR